MQNQLERLQLARDILGEVPVWELQRAGLTVVSKQTLENLFGMAVEYRSQNQLLENMLHTFQKELREREEEKLCHNLNANEEGVVNSCLPLPHEWRDAELDELKTAIQSVQSAT
ncbi:hypothetical protein LLE49_16565 [Alicyclobacillus tolerans]|uniref:hypothetical protein n=1 Tax=Alicyclobacillus tolerans TaxID=90970 RepID=UPI001F1D67A5|nr:hypothetical protein [Alicyclobacillus tolerans]MCF8566336.1 hypothetical protein [Alicyclobacillus tolerans]